MVVFWLPSLLLSLVLSVGLTLLLNVFFPLLFMPIVLLGAMLFLGFNLMFSGLIRR